MAMLNNQMVYLIFIDFPGVQSQKISRSHGISHCRCQCPWRRPAASWWSLHSRPCHRGGSQRNIYGNAPYVTGKTTTNWLVVWNMAWLIFPLIINIGKVWIVWKMAFIFPLILGMSSSQLTNSLHHFSEGWLKPPTRNSGENWGAADLPAASTVEVCRGLQRAVTIAYDLNTYIYIYIYIPIHTHIYIYICTVNNINNIYIYTYKHKYTYQYTWHRI